MPTKSPTRLLVAALLLVICASACGKKKDVEDPSDKPSGATLNDNTPEEPPDELAFDEEAAKIVLDRGARKAENCPSSSGAPSGEGDIQAVFDGPKGRIVDVKLGYPWTDAPEQAQDCIKNAFIGEIIPPFTGEKTVSHAIKLAEPAKQPKQPKKP